MSSRLSAKVYVATWIVFIFIVFRRGAAACTRIGPLYGGEIAIVIFSLLWMRRACVARFVRNPFGFVTVLFLLAAVPPIVSAYSAVGITFAMQGAIGYYVVFIYFGYAALHSSVAQRYFIATLYFVLVLNAFLVILLSVSSIRGLVPCVGGEPVLGSGGGGYVFYTVGIAYAVIYCRELGSRRAALLLILSFVNYFNGFERGCMLATVGVVAILIYHRRMWWSSTVRTWLTAAIIAIAGIASIVINYFPETRLSEHIEAQGDAALSIIGKSDFRSGSRNHRLEMWERVIAETIDIDPWFGQGFQRPLIEESFKSPHNSFVEIFGYMGLVGAVLAAVLYVLFPLMTAIRLGRGGYDSPAKDIVFYLCYTMSFYGAAFFGPTLISPYSALVSSFFFGAFIRCVELQARKTSPQRHPHPISGVGC